MKDDKVYIEYLWAYDWWLSWYNKEEEDKKYHRVDNSLILEIKQPIEYWPMYFKTEAWNYFKNLYTITKEVYDNIWKS